MKPKAPPPGTASERLLGGILGIAAYVFIVYLFLGYPYQAFRLSRSGQPAVATVTSCEFFMKISRGRSRPRWRWEIVYDGHVARTDYTWPVEPGKRIPVLYLPENPSVVEIGLPGDSTWTIMVKNTRGYAVLGVAVCFVVVVAPPVLLGINVVLAFVTPATDVDIVSVAFGGSRSRDQACPACLESQLGQQEEYDSKLRQLMQAWHELDPSALGLTVGEAIQRFQGSPQRLPAARTVFFELGSAKKLKSSLSKAKGAILDGSRFEVLGKRGDETIWRLAACICARP